MDNGKYVLRIESDADKIIEISDYCGDQMPMIAIGDLSKCIWAISEIERLDCEQYYNEIKEDLMKKMADVYISLMALLGDRYCISAEDINEQIRIKTSMKK